MGQVAAIELKLRPSAVHEMAAAMTKEKAAMISTQAASTVTSCRVATAVGLADPNAWFLGGRDSIRLGWLVQLEQQHGVCPGRLFPVVISERVTLPKILIVNVRAF